MTTVYTIAHAHFEVFTSSTLMSFFLIAMGVGFFRAKLSERNHFMKPLFQIFGSFFILFSISLMPFSYHKFTSLKTDYENGNYRTVKGKIYNFSSSARYDFFKVNNDGFTVHDQTTNRGYNVRCLKGGYLKPGRLVELAVIGDSIVKIGVADIDYTSACKG